jgi:hypothetical protein
MQPQEITRMTEMKSLIQEACSALAQLDAERLEELARSCRALNQSPLRASWVEREARAASAELLVLRSVLAATRANFDVLARVLRLRERPLAYDPRPISSPALRRENPYGDH